MSVVYRVLFSFAYLTGSGDDDILHGGKGQDRLIGKKYEIFPIGLGEVVLFAS